MVSKVLKGMFILALVLMPGVVVMNTSAAPAVQPQQEGDAEAGRYVAALAGGCGCHMGDAGFMAGGSGPNITQDVETGIGGWSDQEIADAIRFGWHPDGHQLGGMPFPMFSQISDEDIMDMVAFLRTIEPVTNDTSRPPRPEPLPRFEPATLPPATAPMEGVARGEYIVNGPAACGTCHTPTAEDGTLDMSRYLGGKIGSRGVVANLTPHETGLGNWTEEQIATYLRTGMRPDGTVAEGGRMAHLIEAGYQHWTESDAMAVAMYLKSLEPIALEMPAEEPPMEEPPAEEPPAEEPPMEEPPAEEPPMEEPPAEEPPMMEEPAPATPPMLLPAPPSEDIYTGEPYKDLWN